MRKIFNFKILLILIIALLVSMGSILASAAGGSTNSSSSGSGGSGNGGTIDYADINLDTFSGDSVCGSVSIMWSDDVNYGVNFRLYAEGDNLPNQLHIFAELYDADNNLLTDVLIENAFDSSLELDSYLDYVLENTDADYIIKFHVCDENGQEVSEKQTVTLSYEVCDIRYGYVVGSYSSGINPVTTLEILDADGQLNEFSFAGRPVLNNITTTSVDGNAIVGKFAKFELKSTTGAIRRLNYYDSVVSDNRCSLFTIPGTDNDIQGIYVPYDDTIDGTYTICSSFNNGLLSTVNIQQMTESGSLFIIEKECTDIKIMNWKNLTTLIPVCDASNLNLFAG